MKKNFIPPFVKTSFYFIDPEITASDIANGAWSYLSGAGHTMPIILNWPIKTFHTREIFLILPGSLQVMKIKTSINGT